MNAWIDPLNGAGDAWRAYVFNAAWQGALLGALILAVVALGRRWPSPLRYWLLVLALVKFAIPPMLSLPVGLFSLASPIASQSDSAATRMSDLSAAAPANDKSASDIAPWQLDQTASAAHLVDRFEEFPVISTPLDWPAWLMLTHIAGILAVGGWIAFHLSGLRRLSGRAQPFDARLTALAADCARQLGLRRAPRLRLSDAGVSPMAFGLFRPTIILPASAADALPEAELRTILAHELAHFRRGDLWINWLQILLFAAWWFHPVVWLLNRAIRRTREDCCDDLLLVRGLTDGERYSATLIHAAKQLNAMTPIGAALGFAERLHPLGRRLKRIMDGRLKRTSKISIPGVLLVLVLAVLLLPGLTPRAAEPPRNTNPSKGTLASGESRSATIQSTLLYIAGPGAAKPGVHVVPGIQMTRGDMFKLAGVEPQKLRAQGNVANSIMLWPGYSGSGQSAELVEQSLTHPDSLTITIGDLFHGLFGGPNARWPEGFDPNMVDPHVILWVGPPVEWELFEKATRKAVVVSGKVDPQKVADYREQGRSVKLMTEDSLGDWPPQYDELMALAQKAEESGHWPGGESWLGGVNDETAVRQLIQNAVAAIKKKDDKALESLLNKQLDREDIIHDGQEMTSLGFQLGKIASMTIHDNRALIVTDFFPLKQPDEEPMQCVIYRAEKTAGAWRIRDIDLESTQGLVEEVQNFERK